MSAAASDPKYASYFGGGHFKCSIKIASRYWLGSVLPCRSTLSVLYVDIVKFTLVANILCQMFF